MPACGFYVGCSGLMFSLVRLEEIHSHEDVEIMVFKWGSGL